MKTLYKKMVGNILLSLLFGAFLQNAKANDHITAIKKTAFAAYNLSIADTIKRNIKKKDIDIDKDRIVDSDKPRSKNQPEDGVDNDIMARAKQEFDLTKDPAINRVPVERLLQAKKIKDQILIRQASNIKKGGVSPGNTISTIQWQERGPNNVGGRTRALIFDIGDAANGYKRVFAGGVGGGLWVTSDITATTVQWTKINDFFDNIAISCIAQNPVNPKEIYAGTGEGFYNNDAIQGLGVWKSSDGGVTWAQLPSTEGFKYINAILVDRNGSVYIAGKGDSLEGFGIDQSTDGGDSWTNVINSSEAGADLQLAANGDVYASTGIISLTGHIYISDYIVNGGHTGNSGTWTNITPETNGVITPATTSWNRIKLATAPSDPNIVYAFFEPKYVAPNYSTNLSSVQQYNKSANTWTVKTVPGEAFGNGQSWYSIAAAVDPNNPSILYAGSLDAEKSTDGGQTWTQYTQWNANPSASNYVHADHHAYVYPPGSSTRLLMGTDGGVFYTVNANATPSFVNKNNGYDVTQYYAVALHPTNTNYFLAGAQDNGTQQYKAAGLNATATATGGDGGDAFIDQLNGNIQITSYTYNNHWISVDGGVTFTEEFFGSVGSFINPSDYDSNQKILYSGSYGGEYFRWNNVTSTGSPATSGVSVSGFNGGGVSTVTVSPVTSNRVYFGLHNGPIVRVDNANTGTTNTGVILTPNPSVTASVSCISVDPNSEDHLLVSYFNYGVVSIYETKNATAATPVWVPVEGNLPDMPVRWCMFYPDAPTRAIIATELGVWTTDALNGTATVWAPTNSGLANVRVDMLKFRASDRTLAAATHGRGLFTTILPAVTAPVISYSSPQTYLTGTAIAALGPISNWVSAPGYNAGTAAIGSGFSNPSSVAADAAGNVYVVDHGNNAVKKIPVGGGAPVSIGSGFNQPFFAASDAAGNVYVADYGNNAVKKIPVGGGATVSLGSGFSNPTGVALDAAGNVYVADYGNKQIKMIPVGGGAPVTISSAFNQPYGIAVDAAGNVYVADATSSAIIEIPAGGGPAVSLGSGFVALIGVAVDAVGNVYCADLTHTSITEIPAGGGAAVALGSGFGNPYGVAIDGAGNVYVADYSKNAVDEIKPAGGYYIGPFLPAGLNFDTATGIITGTPTKSSPATNYTITAYNNLGHGKATANIKITANANLANLKISIGTLSPVFSAGTTSYTASIANTITSITITPAVSDAAATIKVNGAAVTSGSASASLPLAIGANTITTIVTASDGTTTKTYTVTATRAPSTDALLTSVKLTPVSTLTVVPGPGYVNYKTTVANTTSSLTVTAAEQDPTATIKVNGVTTTPGTASAPITLTTGSNTITIVSTAQDGVTTKTYIITATKATSSNAGLSALKISSGVLAPVFATATSSYTANVTNAIASITVTPTTSDATATVTVNGAAVTSGSASASIPLTVGPNTITTTIAAQDGTTTKTYTITVTRARSTDALLTSIKLIPASTLTVVAGPGYVNYTTTVAATTSSVTVTATVQDATATIKVNGVTTASGTASVPITLVTGSNVITTVVTAQDGVTTKTYTITATKPISSNANLSALKISSGTLTPTFAMGTTSYTASVTNATASITVTPTTSDPTATVKINGTAVISGTASTAIPLTVGPNTVTTIVTAQGGTTTKTYNITVTRSGSTDALLTSIKLTPASTLSIVTGPGYVNYTTSTPNTTSSVTVTATKQDATATIKVNGITTASGTASASIPLAVGSNTITTTVTAQDGITTKNYIITATRAAPPGINNPDETLSVTKPADNVTIENDGITVHQGVSPNGDGINDFLKIDGIANYPDNNLTIVDRNGLLVYEAKGYGSNSALFDGHSSVSGKMQLAGTYFYSLDYTVNGQVKHQTGYIILKY